MVIAAGKSRKNVAAYVLIPPDSKQAIELLINAREVVGVPKSNPYIFARVASDTPISGDMKDVIGRCTLQHPERITSTSLRKYIGTVCQVSYQRIHSLKKYLMILRRGRKRRSFCDRFWSF